MAGFGGLGLSPNVMMGLKQGAGGAPRFAPRQPSMPMIPQQAMQPGGGAGAAQHGGGRFLPRGMPPAQGAGGGGVSGGLLGELANTELHIGEGQNALSMLMSNPGQLKQMLAMNLIPPNLIDFVSSL